MSRAEVEARNREASSTRKASNPMNRLVPYLDLFSRLSDEELSRLARTPTSAVESLRQQVEEVNRALGRYVDLLPRLSDDELARLTGATLKTIRFWRLSQPRHLQGDAARRRTNPDVTPAPQPIPRRESSSASSAVLRRTEEDSAELSSAPVRSASGQLSGPVIGPSEDFVEDPDPTESSTFVIDTIE